ncbi:MAG: DnaD domain protein [Clostridiales bacterium]|jgi:DnaD/phage-associated family protein|nr:DnaD domain protein [Clostridiales bacterium]
MGYRVNPDAWGYAFAVPSIVVDNHIKMAGAIQLKVLLWLLRNSPEEADINVISRAVGKTSEDVTDALAFWVECGVLLKDGQAPAHVNSEPEKSDVAKAEQKVLAPIPPARPTSEQIKARCGESEDIRFLFNEAQTKLGKTIGYDGQSTLLMMHDQYGLPVEVVLMIIEYCVSVSKTSLGYISSVGKDWGEREIDTLEKADEQIEALKSCNALWKKLAQAIGNKNPRPTTKQSVYINRWSREWGFSFEMIYLAYEEMADRTQSLQFAYMDKILKNWHENGLKTPEEVEQFNRERLNKNKGKSRGTASKKQKGSRSPASYDLDEFKRRSLHEPLVYEKGKK